MRKYTVAGLTLVLIAALSCGNDDDGPMGPVGPSGPATGDIMVSLVMSGSDLDADGCAVTVDSGSGQQVSPGATVAFSDLTSGSHEVTIGDVAANCEVDGATSRSVTVAAGQTAREVFTVVCAWGSRIAFTHHDAVHVMNPDGTGRAQLTHHGTGVWGPAWSPDGTRVATASDDASPAVNSQRH